MAAEANMLTWAGKCDLPSLDPGCLQAMAYAKFAGFPTKVTNCNNPYKSPTATLPVLRLPDDMFCGCDDIIDYLKANNYNADEELSDKQKTNTLGLCCYVEDMLRPALLKNRLWQCYDLHTAHKGQDSSRLFHIGDYDLVDLYMMWLDEQNYTQFTRGWHAKQLKFPYNYTIPANYFKHAENFIAHKLNIEESDVISVFTEGKLNKRAAACFEVLNNMLGDQDFFFGDSNGFSPTTLDSKVFSYLAVMLRIELPANKLKALILEYPRLEKFCDNIFRLYFPSVARELEPAKRAKAEAEESRKNKINAVLSVGFAVVVMVFYALSNGIVTIEFVETDSCEDCQNGGAEKTAKK